MNTGTKFQADAMKTAQAFADETGDPQAVHKNAFDPNEHWWITPLPSSMKRAKGRWAKEQEARGAKVVWPSEKKSLQPPSSQVKASTQDEP